MYATTEEAMTAAIAHMDENYPGWYERIDLSTFDITDCDLCVLGQAVSRDAWDWTGHFDAPDFSAFASPNAEPYWRDEISRRLGAILIEETREEVLA